MSYITKMDDYTFKVVITSIFVGISITIASIAFYLNYFILGFLFTGSMFCFIYILTRYIKEQKSLTYKTTPKICDI